MIYSDAVIRHSELLAESFLKLTGNPLIKGELRGMELAEAIYNANFVLVSHGVEKDPLFNYANVQAQLLWEMDWSEFTNMPSRLSAETMLQSERQKLLEKAQQQGYISDYNGIRISKSGKKFRILNTVLWNVMDDQFLYKGQAAMFEKWEFI